jgi:hypothetical protein
LNHEAIVVILERQDALHAQDVDAEALRDHLHPEQELSRVERLVSAIGA